VHLYFLFIRIAALFGHKKARALVRGQKSAFSSQLSDFCQCIWIHAASVGEFEQARPLIERLRLEQPKKKIVVTFFSPSGYEARKNYEQADSVLYLPFATRRNARKFIEALQPSMAVFVKYEFWPAYIRELKKRNIPTYSISAIFRPEQIFFRFWGKRHLRVLKSFTKIFVQDEASRQLLEKHGVSHVSVTGDTRFDRVSEVQRDDVTKDLRSFMRFTEGCERVIVAGSTWPEDEVLLEKYIGHLTLDIGHLSTKLILVPHELDEKHLHFIFQLFQGKIVRLSAVCQSFVSRLSAASQQNILQHAQVLVVDEMGLLSSLYRFGQVAYIGGGFGVGIHNTIEAAVYGVPVIFGPNYEHFREAKGLIAAGAARSIKKYSELEAALDTALENHETIGAKAAEYVESERGATAKIYEQIFAN
jgi:3-deoxy-D-manno-octulosonic-acid transferase